MIHSSKNPPFRTDEEDEQADAYGTDDQWWSSLVDDTIAEENEDDSDQEDLEPEDQAKIWDTDTTNPFGAGAADEATKAAPVGNAAAAGQSSVQPRSVQSGSSLHSATVPAGPSPAAAQPAAPLASTTSLPAQHVAVAPSVSGGAGAGPVGMRARLDSRKLAKAPRTTTSRFQASLRHSIRHLGEPLPSSPRTGKSSETAWPSTDYAPVWDCGARHRGMLEVMGKKRRRSTKEADE